VLLPILKGRVTTLDSVDSKPLGLACGSCSFLNGSAKVICDVRVSLSTATTPPVWQRPLQFERSGRFDRLAVSGGWQREIRSRGLRMAVIGFVSDCGDALVLQLRSLSGPEHIHQCGDVVFVEPLSPSFLEYLLNGVLQREVGAQ